MNVEETLRARDTLAEEIKAAIGRFESTCGLEVRGVSIERLCVGHMQSPDATVLSAIGLEVRLP